MTLGWGVVTIQNENMAERGARLVTYGFTLNGEYTYYTSNSDHKPYMEVTVADDNAGLYACDLRPNGGFANNRDGAPLTWGWSRKPGTIGELSQARAVVTWQYGGATHTATLTGEYTPFTIPAAQLPEQGNVTWSVTVTDTAGNVNASETATFTTTDSTGYASPESPINQYIDGSKVVPLTWFWDISTGTTATKANIQTSTDNGTTWVDLGTVTGQQPYIAAPGTLPAGNVLWRVRGYNTDGAAGPWSTGAAIVVRQAPAAPIISSVTPVPRPTITWQAAGQQAYQLQVGAWDSGPVYGTAKTAQVPDYLPDGPTEVRLRVQNSFGLWSPWATASVTIANRPGAPIPLRTRTVPGGVRLSWTGDYPAYAIYRDGAKTGETTAAEYIDYLGNGKCSYMVRGINRDSTYTDSPTVVEILRPRDGLIARVGEWDWLPLRCLRGRYPTASTGEQVEVSYTHYSGLSLPAAEISEHRSRQHTLEFTLRRREELEALRNMLGALVVYKDLWGRLFVGVLDSLDVTSDWVFDVSFTITEVDHGPEL